MTEKYEPRSTPYVEIPSRSILEAAQEHRRGAQLLFDSRFIRPFEMVAAISLELYLKSLAATEFVTPDDLSSSPLSGVITEKANIRGHKLCELYDAIDGIFQSELTIVYSTGSRLFGEDSFKSALNRCNNLFAESRYHFEPTGIRHVETPGSKLKIAVGRDLLRRDDIMQLVNIVGNYIDGLAITRKFK